VAVEVTVIAACMAVGLPCALAIQPQTMTLPVASLEDHIKVHSTIPNTPSKHTHIHTHPQEAAAARGLEFVFANKGL
jgi:hypothetical protein